MNEETTKNENTNTTKDDSPIKIFLNDTFNKFNNSSDKAKKRIIIVSLVITYLLGIGSHMLVGVKRSAYKSLLSDNAKITNQLKEANTNSENIQKEYDDYKSKMQPYEAQQQADVKAAEEKKKAEEEARKAAEEAQKEKERKEAEEKAAKEAEEKRQAEEKAKANSLGLTIDEFYKNFNANATSNGLEAFLGKATTSNSMTSYLTLNADTRINCFSNDSVYLSVIYINAKRTTPESLIESGHHVIATLITLDPSISLSEADNVLADLTKGASNTLNEDYVIVHNSLKCTATATSESIVFAFQKNN